MDYRVTDLQGVAGSSAIQYIYTVEVDDRKSSKSSRAKESKRSFKVETASAFPRLIYLTACVIIATILCHNYISLRMDIASISKNIDYMQGELLEISKKNNEEYDRISASIDIEQIRQTALEELHMTYPTNDQVIVISPREDDYVRQFRDFK